MRFTAKNLFPPVNYSNMNTYILYHYNTLAMLIINSLALSAPDNILIISKSFTDATD